MDTRELKKIYYSLLANDPDYPAWEEFEYLHVGCWIRPKEPLRHNTFNEYEFRHNPKPEKWQPLKCNWSINTLYNESKYIEDPIQERVEAGLMRETKEQAEQDLDQIRQFTRFLAWRAEKCPGRLLEPLDYVGCFLSYVNYHTLRDLINNGEVEL